LGPIRDSEDRAEWIEGYNLNMARTWTWQEPEHGKPWIAAERGFIDAGSNRAWPGRCSQVDAANTRQRDQPRPAQTRPDPDL